MNMVYKGVVDGTVLMLSTLGGLGPMVALWAVSRVSKEVDFGEIISGINIRKFDRWALLAVFTIPTIYVISNHLTNIVQGSEQPYLLEQYTKQYGGLILPIILVHFTASLLTSPLFEEPGWRGFALIRLQRRYGRETGSLIVGLMWWLWHQPMWITFGVQISALSLAIWVTKSMALDSLYNLSNRNLFVAMLTHQSWGTVYMFFQNPDGNIMTLFVALLFALVLKFVEVDRKR